MSPVKQRAITLTLAIQLTYNEEYIFYDPNCFRLEHYNYNTIK